MGKEEKEERKESRQIDFKYNLKTYWSFVKNYKLLAVISLVVLILIELSFVADKFLFKSIVDNGTLFAAGTLLKSAFISILFVLLFIFLGILVFRVVMRWLSLYFINRFETRLIADLKRRFFNHIVQLSHSFHTTHKTGSLISRVIRGGNSIERITDVFAFGFIPLAVQFVAITLSLIYFNIISAAVIFVMVVAFVAFSLIVQIRGERLHAVVNLCEDNEKANISDIFTNIDSVKYFGKENFIRKKFHEITEGTKKAFLRYWDISNWLSAGQTLILGLGTFMLVYFPLASFLNGQIELGTLVFVYTIFGNIAGSLFSFVHGLRDFHRSMVDFEDLFQYGKIENDIKDKPDAKELKIKEGRVGFNELGFSYHKRKIFENFNLEIPANKKVALVGPSGCGKTTLIKLLYRFYNLDKGKILIDGKDIADFKQESLRAELSVVPQEAVLFDDSIYNNIAFSNPDASRQEVLQAIKFAQLDKIIKNFPYKENTIVGERGVRLSGGEKQRVSIARAILADKKILILDEATSSLDSQTEHEIQAALKKLMENRTSIIIAHRLSTIMSADLIVVIDKGKIVQMGKHEQLISKPGLYKKLWNLQKGGYIK